MVFIGGNKHGKCYNFVAIYIEALSAFGAYPLTCLSYVFGLLAACLFLHESIPGTRWIGVIFVAFGVYFIIK